MGFGLMCDEYPVEWSWLSPAQQETVVRLESLDYYYSGNYHTTTGALCLSHDTPGVRSARIDLDGSVHAIY